MISLRFKKWCVIRSFESQGSNSWWWLMMIQYDRWVTFDVMHQFYSFELGRFHISTGLHCNDASPRRSRLRIVFWDRKLMTTQGCTWYWWFPLILTSSAPRKSCCRSSATRMDHCGTVWVQNPGESIRLHKKQHINNRIDHTEGHCVIYLPGCSRIIHSGTFFFMHLQVGFCVNFWKKTFPHFVYLNWCLL